MVSGAFAFEWVYSFPRPVRSQQGGRAATARWILQCLQLSTLDSASRFLITRAGSIAGVDGISTVLMLEDRVLADWKTSAKTAEPSRGWDSSVLTSGALSVLYIIIARHFTSSSVRPRDASRSSASTHVAQIPYAMAARSNSAFE